MVTPSLPPAPLLERPDVVRILDESNPNTVLSKMPEVVREKAKLAIQKDPDLFVMDEHELMKVLRARQQYPTPTDNSIRLKFWIEYDRCMDQGGPLNVRNVLSGAATFEHFYDSYLKFPNKVAWMLCPPTAYSTRVEEGLVFGLEQLRDILSLEHFSETTRKLDHKLVALKIAIVKMLDERRNGAPLQRSLSLIRDDSRDRAAVRKMATEMTEEDLDKRLKELERKERKALHLPDGNEVLPAEEA